MDDLTERQDLGVLEGKHMVPVTALYGGDTGDEDEQATVVLGPLKCRQVAVGEF